MARAYELVVEGHPSVYQPKERKLKIYYSEPEKGVSEDTGILLLISGFGANANSKVYQKMRNQFADAYNLVTIQCDYFGWQYMQGADSVENFSYDMDQFSDYTEVYRNLAFEYKENYEVLLEIAKRNQKNFILKADLDENWSDFNDMGMMQAIDNITAVMEVLKAVGAGGSAWNENKVIVYGHSHGAYLGHLCNLFMPDFFTLLIDNSAWIMPLYLKNYRSLTLQNGVHLIFEYLVGQLMMDEEIYNLRNLYDEFDNTCEIIAFHGQEDHLITDVEKKALIDTISNATFYLVSEQTIDHEVFRSAGHGLNADFLKMFDLVMKDRTFPPRKKLELKNIHIHTDMADYYINYDTGRPQLTCIFPQ